MWPEDTSPHGAFPLSDAIVIRGARTHNLKNLSCEIPHGKLTVISGVSGSGKSSLAFDTIYAEGQRRYVESLSAYARQFLERIEKPDADEIDGLAPAIAIKQKNTTRNPRSTVATATEIYDYLRLLYARCGEGALHLLRRAGEAQFGGRGGRGGAGAGRGNAAECAVPRDERGARGRSRKIAKPAKSGESGGRATKTGAKSSEAQHGDSLHMETMKARLADLRPSGFNRLWQQGRIFEFSTPESLLDLDLSAPVLFFWTASSPSAENRARIVDAVEIAYREAGEVIFEEAPRRPADEAARCDPGTARGPGEGCGFRARTNAGIATGRAREPEPQLFSFNNPFGACPRCQGFGNTVDFDLNLVIPDTGLSLNRGSHRPVEPAEVQAVFYRF